MPKGYISAPTSNNYTQLFTLDCLLLVEPEIPYHTELRLNPDIDNDKVRCDEDQSNIMLLYVYTSANNFRQCKRVRRTWASVRNILLFI